jgi:HEPN domain-containing protein
MNAKTDGDSKSIEGEAGRWFSQAQADLKTAEILFESGRHYMVCFLSQQIAEKALKAFLYSKGRDLVFGHSVIKLCEYCAEYDERFDELKKEIKNLDQFYIEARYPNGLPESVPAEFFDENDAESALYMARRAMEVVEEAVPL